MNTRLIRGFNDILPDTIKRWHHIEDAARVRFELYGFSEIRTPVIEFTELFARSIGTATDIVEKEMYTFTDRDGSSLSLRPEGTAGVVRSFIEHSMHKKAPVTKLYYTGMMFRHERPQKGRFRGFSQIGAEYLGEGRPEADVELIAMLDGFFETLGISGGLTLELNSLGTAASRAVFKERLVEFLTPHVDGLCEDCRRRLQTNPMRVLDCKREGCGEVLTGAPSILDSLAPEDTAHFAEVRAGLDALGVEYVINPRIVRGLDYYCRTVFEFTSEELGAQNTVAAGGRYDGLVEELGGPPTPAVGFALGIERMLMLHEMLLPEGFERRVDVFIAYLGDEARRHSILLARDLRHAGVSVEMSFGGTSLKSQLKRADRHGAKSVLIIGGSELERGVVRVRDMQAGTEEDVPADAVLADPASLKHG